MALTKREKKILADFGNDPNYRIETNARNQIIAVQLKPEKSDMQRFIEGEEFTLKLFAFDKIRFRFDEKQSLILNESGADPIPVLAAFVGGFLYKQENGHTSRILFTDVNFINNDQLF
ncbi:hypothetical protein ACFSR6_03430 [Pedobacter vanadiisoli]|uniref:Uncharacterized protein n=1 Tax=Pedobacter vanadiisoli TaxID=1761975 RepID=A0ABW5MFM0_9SPHI